MRRRPAEMLRRALPNDEAELRLDGPEVVVREGGEERLVESKMSNDACDSGGFSARGRHANDNERLYEYLVAAGRRGVGKKIAAAKAASADAKRVQRNKRSREKRQEEKRRTATAKSEVTEEEQAGSAEGEQNREQGDQSALIKEQTKQHEKVVNNFTAEWPEDCAGTNHIVRLKLEMAWPAPLI